MNRITACALACQALGGTAFAASQPAQLDGITFASNPNRLLIPLREISNVLGLSLTSQDNAFHLNGRKLAQSAPKLPNGTRLIPIAELRTWGVAVQWNDSERRALLDNGGKQVFVMRGKKRVVIDKTRQEIRALQGARTVLRSEVSTGKRGYRTPNGQFEAGPYKAHMHRSSLYDNAPMPWSVQITGDIFVHGYEAVPETPASHGCIRLPLDGTARFFYDWIDVGTPVRIAGKWKK